MEEVIHVAGKRAHKIRLLESLHTDGTLGSGRPFGDTHPVGLHRALIAAKLTPIVRITLYEAILHISVNFTAVLPKHQLLQALKNLLVLLVNDVFRVTIEELLLITPEGLRREGGFSADAEIDCPQQKSANKDKEHD